MYMHYVNSIAANCHKCTYYIISKTAQNKKK